MALFFLPGAAGSASFWLPVAAHLPNSNDGHFFNWPGLGSEAHSHDVQSIDDLIRLVSSKLTEPSALIAQSMGGYIALRVALERPDMVTHLVLAVASAGLAMDEFGAIDWRGDYARTFPNAANYITTPTQDLSARLCEVAAPCLLLWGGRDQISPVGVGERLQSLMPDSRLVVFEKADHDLAYTHAIEVAELIRGHIGLPPYPLPKNTSGSS